MAKIFKEFIFQGYEVISDMEGCKGVLISMGVGVSEVVDS